MANSSTFWIHNITVQDKNKTDLGTKVCQTVETFWVNKAIAPKVRRKTVIGRRRRTECFGILLMYLIYWKNIIQCIYYRLYRKKVHVRPVGGEGQIQRCIIY